ncbi:hypothetical protein OAY86_02700 [Candidatus Pelagibacter sp.]|nr:hypothetical protein [Candidatus Pelagibacter sp.]|tara:strand:+ start:653 stop:2143 length:1491 start_codon:yes stop_codon:yes gene_type:complete
MSKHNFFSKGLKKHFLSINNTIESYFNKLKFFILNFKKIKSQYNNKGFIIFGIIFILILGYFLLPTIYDNKIIQSKIKDQIYNQYNFEIKFNEKVKYALFPKPYFFTNNLLILDNKKTIAEVKKFKTFISLDSLFKMNYVNIKDVIFNDTEFNLNKDNVNFFKKLFLRKPNKNNIIIKNSTVFFKNLSDEVLFLGKINSSKFFYDEKKLNNNLISKNEIFNLPFLLKLENDNLKDYLLVELESKKIRLDIINEIDFSEEIKKGIMDISIFNKKTFINYILDNKSLSFSSKDKKNFYNGKIDFKPFFLSADFNYEILNLKNLLNDDSFLFEIIRSEVLNNKNLNLRINFFLKNIINLQQLNSLKLNIEIIEGNINFSNSHIMWNDDFKISLRNSLLSYDKNQINLIGKINIDFNNIDDFFSSFQIKKINRKQVKEIEFDFVYNIDNKKINFDNPRIDKNSNLNVEKFLQNFNLENEKFFNKITFKNFVNDFFDAYAG